jgi:hypothetical protein
MKDSPAMPGTFSQDELLFNRRNIFFFYEPNGPDDGREELCCVHVGDVEGGGYAELAHQDQHCEEDTTLHQLPCSFNQFGKTSSIIFNPTILAGFPGNDLRWNPLKFVMTDLIASLSYGR